MEQFIPASTLYKLCYLLSAIDFMISTILASSGDKHFILFAVLAFVMWVYGMIVKTQVDKEGE
jgi:hypothetical protein